MKRWLNIGVPVLLMMLLVCHWGYAQVKPRILIFSKTLGYRHDNIEKAAEVIKKLGLEHGFDADHSEDATLFSDRGLQPYQAVVFLSTSGDLFDKAQQEALMRYIQAGNGFVGIHAASTTGYSWPWFGKMVGGYFSRHPHVQPADIHVVNRTHPATEHLPEVWRHVDEWYDFRGFNPDVQVLLRLDEKSYEGGGMGEDHPIAWYHDYDGGRVFYTALGHTEASFDEPAFQQHIVGGIRYAIGSPVRK